MGRRPAKGKRKVTAFSMLRQALGGGRSFGKCVNSEVRTDVCTSTSFLHALACALESV